MQMQQSIIQQVYMLVCCWLVCLLIYKSILNCFEVDRVFSLLDMLFDPRSDFIMMEFKFRETRYLI